MFQQRGYLILQQFYGTDLHQDRLKVQLIALHCSDTVLCLKDFDEVEKEYYYEVIKVILVMPATNTLSECSFSALRRTWLRTTTDQVHLNSCITFHVHKNRTDSIPLLRIGNEFIQRNSSRVHILDNIQYTIYITIMEFLYSNVWQKNLR